MDALDVSVDSIDADITVNRNMGHWVNLSPHGQNDCHFPDSIFRRTYTNEKCCILIKILLKFVPEAPIDNNPALV